ncbi:MAG: hypothetical protein AAGB51_13540 [Planctomycetota bacterium]
MKQDIVDTSALFKIDIQIPYTEASAEGFGIELAINGNGISNAILAPRQRYNLAMSPTNSYGVAVQVDGAVRIGTDTERLVNQSLTVDTGYQRGTDRPA